MTPDQYKAALEKLDLSIVGAAPYIGVSRRQSQRFAADGGPGPPEPVAHLLQVVVKHKVNIEELPRMLPGPYMRLLQVMARHKITAKELLGMK